MLIFYIMLWGTHLYHFFPMLLSVVFSKTMKQFNSKVYCSRIQYLNSSQIIIGNTQLI